MDNYSVPALGSDKRVLIAWSKRVVSRLDVELKAIVGDRKMPFSCRIESLPAYAVPALLSAAFANGWRAVEMTLEQTESEKIKGAVGGKYSLLLTRWPAGQRYVRWSQGPVWKFDQKELLSEWVTACNWCNCKISFSAKEDAPKVALCHHCLGALDATEKTYKEHMDAGLRTLADTFLVTGW